MTKKKPQQKPAQRKQHDASKQDPGRKSGQTGRATQKRGGQENKPKPEDAQKRRPGPEDEEGRPWEPLRDQP